MEKKGFTIIAGVIFVTLLFMLSTKGNIFGEQVYKNDYYGITFSYPEGWEITFTRDKKDDYPVPFLVCFEPKNKEKEDKIGLEIAINKKWYSDVLNAGSLMEFCKTFYGEAQKHQKILNISFEELNLNGRKGVKTECNLIHEPYELRSISYRFIKNNKIYMINFMGENKLYNLMKDDIERAINSFKIE